MSDPRDDRSSSASAADLLLLTGLALGFFFVRLGSGSLHDWDEAIYAQVAKEYLQRSDWLTPTWNGQLWFHKPPLSMWFTAWLYGLVGVGEWAARFGTALGASIGVLATYLFATPMIGRAAALLAALVLLSTRHYLGFGKTGMLDVPVTVFIAIALFAYWRGRGAPPWFLVSGAAFGIAFMIKGVAAGIAPLAAALHMLVTREFRVLRSLWLWAGAALALLLVVPWHLHQAMRHGSRFWNEYLLYHVVARARDPLEGHVGGAFYYLGVVLDKQLPWSILSLFAVPYCAWLAWRERDATLLFFLCWIAAVALVVGCVQTKISWYVLPIYPALSACVAVAAMRIVPERHFAGLVAACLAVLALQGMFSSRVFDLDRSPEVKALAPHIQRSLASDESLFLHGVDAPAALFYGDRHVVPLASLADLAARSPAHGLVRAADRASVARALMPSQVEVIAWEGDHALLRVGPPSPEHRREGGEPLRRKDSHQGRGRLDEAHRAVR